MQLLRVSDNQRHLATADGRTFFWQGDTAWEALHRLTREEMVTYLDARQRQGFTVVQTVAYAEMDRHGDSANAYGQPARYDRDPARPNDAYFDHVDTFFDLAEQHGLYVAFLPTWGHNITPAWSANAATFTVDKARTYGQWIGERYGDRDNLIWVNGGDRPVHDEPTRAIWRALAEGLRAAEAKRHVMTFHPPGPSSSSDWVPDEDWLDVRMIQSGHYRPFLPNGEMIRKDFEREPVKPVLDGEICYEAHPIGFEVDNGRFTDHHVRAAAWSAVLSGACGFTYGAPAIWQMWDEGRPYKDSSLPWGSWQQELDLPGASQMRHIQRVVMSRPVLGGVPDNGLLTMSHGEGDYHGVLRDGTAGQRDATTMVIYGAIRHRREHVKTDVIPADRLRAWVVNPRTGETIDAGEHANASPVKLPIPERGGPDWVFLFDAADAGYSAP